MRVAGPLGLATRDHRAGEDAQLLVYPDLPSARRLALAVRTGRFRESGRQSRGPLGLGTEFESIRDYLPDDDLRQVNWPATARMGRPMSNQYRIEQDRDVICVIDCGRLMAAPLSGGATRLDVAVDAATAVGLVADELGDRCGTVAFAGAIERRLAPRRRGGEALVRAVFDLQPAPVDSDYELAFRTVASSKRALVIVFTDLIEEVAARSLVQAVPVLARRHEVVVAGVVDPDLDAVLATAPARTSSTSTAPPPRSTSSPLASAPPPACAARALASSRPRPRRSAARASPRTSARRRAHGCDEPSAGAVLSRMPLIWRTIRQDRCSLRGSRECGALGSSLACCGRPRTITSDQYAAPTPTPSTMPGTRPNPARVTKPSMIPARMTHGIVPRTIEIAGRASATSAAPRVRGPGATIASPIRRPAAAATAMHDSSMIPCAVTNSANARPLPLPIAPPATAPRIRPL